MVNNATMTFILPLFSKPGAVWPCHNWLMNHHSLGKSSSKGSLKAMVNSYLYSSAAHTRFIEG